VSGSTTVAGGSMNAIGGSPILTLMPTSARVGTGAITINTKSTVFKIDFINCYLLQKRSLSPLCAMSILLIKPMLFLRSWFAWKSSCDENDHIRGITNTVPPYKSI